MKKLLDLLFGEDDGTEPDDVAVFIVDIPDPSVMPADRVRDALELRPPDRYVARLLGLEGEAIMEMEVRPGPDDRPPRTIVIPLARPAGQIKWTADPSKPVCFDEVHYELSTVCGYNICYYRRTTPPFRED